MRFASLLLVFPILAAAQTKFPTDFPADAVVLAPEALRQLLTGKVATTSLANGPGFKITYRGDYAFLNANNVADSGKWRVEGSAVCFDWRNRKPSCAEVRMVGGSMYIKLASSGEVALTTTE